jgi:hypothetical protein
LIALPIGMIRILGGGAPPPPYSPSSFPHEAKILYWKRHIGHIYTFGFDFAHDPNKDDQLAKLIYFTRLAKFNRYYRLF